MQNNVDEEADADGVAIGCYYDSSPLIENCIITDNSCGLGVVTALLGSSPSIIDCNISDNYGISASIQCYDTNDVVVKNCIISNNQVTTQWGGTTGGIMCIASDAQIENCIMTGNTAHDGGGVYLDGSSTAIVRNCSRNVNSQPRCTMFM